MVKNFALTLAISTVLSGVLGNDSHGHLQFVEETFDAKPNGQQSHAEATMDERTCSIDYAVVGGTNEQWIIRIEKGDGAYSCSIRREGGKDTSYLFFMGFSVQFPALSEATVYGNNGVNLGNNEYTLKDDIVSHVDGMFKNALSRIDVFSKA